MNEMTIHEKSALVAMEFNEQQVKLIKDTVARGTTNDQLSLFLYTCKKTGLDPLAKQIHCVVRQTKNGPMMSIQTSIDGYRLIADRSGKYAGNDDPIYDNEEKPRKATVTVYKMVGGVRCGFTATARWEQYYPGDPQGFMWKKMPHLMLGKCAEALALRKAFPAELSGMYTNEEMEQAQVEVKPVKLASSAPLPAEVEIVNPSVDELKAKAEEVKKRKEELEAKEKAAKEAEKALGWPQDPDSEQVNASAPIPVNQEVISGIIKKYYSKSGKKPHAALVDGKYYTSYNDGIGKQMADFVEKLVHITFHSDAYEYNGKSGVNLIVDKLEEPK